jgi:sulfur relay (sulfurtransferase) DsrC/TusE family protein
MPSPVFIPDEWTAEDAEAVAAAEHIVLTEPHWRVIWCWREVAAREGRTPGPDDLLSCCGITRSDIQRLFPGTTSAVLSRIAGVPE